MFSYFCHTKFATLIFCQFIFTCKKVDHVTTHFFHTLLLFLGSFCGLIGAAFFITHPWIIALVGLGLLVGFVLTVYGMILKPLQSAFSTIEGLESRIKSERETHKNRFLHVSQTYPLVGSLFQKCTH